MVRKLLMRETIVCFFVCFFVCCTNNNEYTNYEKNDEETTLIEVCDTSLNSFDFVYDPIIDETSVIYNINYKIILDVYNSEIIGDKLNCPYKIEKNGEIIHSSIGKIDLNKNLKAGILLSFDDCYLDSWKNSIPLFKNNNKKATFFIYGSCNTISSTCLYLQDNGFEVGYHTLGHKNLMDKDSATILDEQCINPLYDFHKKYIYMYSFAFPNGLYVPYQITELLKYFRILRLFNNKVNLYSFDQICNERVIVSQSIDKNKFSSDDDFRKKLFYRFCIAKITNKIYPCTSHEIVSDIQQTSNNYSISEDRLEYMFCLMDDLQLNSYKYSDFYDGIYW
ncbi:MAG: polysaccharide deacetylase family protein [Treponema sp.]|nr:polysaccharide deacetylase family protein [Treponema sp.]